MQRGHGSNRSDTHRRALSYAAAALAALGLTLASVAGAGTPTKHPVASRPAAKHAGELLKPQRVAARQAAAQQPQPKAAPAKPKTTPAKPAARKPGSKRGPSDAEATRSKPSTRTRRRHHAVQDDDREPEVMHRTRTAAPRVAASPLRASAATTKAPAQGLPARLDPNASAEAIEAEVDAQMAQRAPKPAKRTLIAPGIDTAEVTLAPDATSAAHVGAKPEARFAEMSAGSRDELTDEALRPVVLPGLYSRSGRLIVPAPLKGSREILVHQNYMTDQEGLERIQDDDDLNRLRAQHQLINFPESASLAVNHELAADRRCARVWTVRFATDTARAFYARFHEPLQVNSAVRTVAYQVRLQRTNGNAAGVSGEVASPHLSGQALDFGKRGMSVAQIAWMRAYLKPLMEAGKLDVEEEFQQACFHISVYRSYLPAEKPRATRTDVAQLRSAKPVSHADSDQ